MTLIQVKNRTVLAIPSLFREVLRSIYALESMTPMEHDTMMYSIEGWTKHLKYKKEMGLSAVDEETKVSLMIMMSLIKLDQEGKLDQRKAMFKEKGIDYRKFHRLSEAFTQEDFDKGARALEKHKKDNPGDYNAN